TYSDLRLYARELVDADIDPAHSYPVTTLARTLADVALDHSLEVSVPLISQALHDHRVDHETIQACLPPGVRGLNRARLALELSSELHETPAEAFCAVKFHRYGITDMMPQVAAHAVTDEDMCRNDFRHDESSIIVQVYGVGIYTSSPGAPDVAARDNHQSRMDITNEGFFVF